MAPRTYGRWHKWDGKPLAKKPLFYQAVDTLAFFFGNLKGFFRKFTLINEK
jgi:hypothetical protein